MLWLLIAGGAAITTVGAMALIGLLLPKRHVVTRRAHFPQGQDHLWLVMTDHTQEPTWRPALRRIERLSDRDGRPVWREFGYGGHSMTLETVEVHAPARLVRRIAAPARPFMGSWIYTLAATADGSTLTITEDGTISNPIVRCLARGTRTQHRTIDAYLHALARHLTQTPSAAAEPLPRPVTAPQQVARLATHARRFTAVAE